MHPVSGEVYLLDARTGVYQLEADGGTTHVWHGDAAQYGIQLPSEYTDLADLPDGTIAITAHSFGYLLDLEADTFQQHFCYEPGFVDDPNLWLEERQITDSLTYNTVTGQLMAQPQTIDLNTTDVLRSEVATFDVASGEDLAWTGIVGIASLRAGAMVALDADTVLLAAEATLYSWSPQNGLRFDYDFLANGISSVEGMALDANAERLYVIDASTRELVVLAYKPQ
ncbi:MAG: hypothetical protein ACI9MR_002588 [Myxococcota bacterium]